MMLVEKGTVIAGRYRLTSPLARGGMGSVWVARHLTLDVDVAIKLMAPDLASSPGARGRFEREAKASASLRIPNAVHVHDYGLEDGTPYLAMELLDGEDLEARLRRVGRLDGAAMSHVVSQVSKALRRAHEIGLVHRDLKPGNLFLARQGGEEILKVLDFGIAKAPGLGVVGTVTKTGTLLGSPLYMSPEQIRRSKAVDHRSDLWSLGVIVFEGLTGRLPFQGEDLGELLFSICSAEIPRASRIAPDLGPEVDRFFARALAREPADRFQSADELASALAEATSAPALPCSPATATVLAAPLPSAAPQERAGTLSPHGTTMIGPPVRRARRWPLSIAVAGALGLAVLATFVVRVFTTDEPPIGSAGSDGLLPAPTALSAEAPLPTAPLPTAPVTTAPVATPTTGPDATTTTTRPPALRPSAPPSNKPRPPERAPRDKDPTRHI